MSFATHQKGHILIVTINLSRATIRESDDFKSLLLSYIEKGTNHIVIDFSSCDFVDSSFLGVLVLVLRRVTSTGGDVHLVGFKPAVRSMFELTRMHKVFELFDNIEDAVKSFELKK